MYYHRFVNKFVNILAGNIKFLLISMRARRSVLHTLLLPSNYLAGRGCYLTANFVFAYITCKRQGGVSCVYDVTVRIVNNRDTNNHVNLAAFIF